ncbi:hypothetical protein MSG28_011424 [Choristoneura fumiferana]|uniref:Uncharacterized protein n=1 Tax=Choristoneura fumiferana TaxID=7141 RepID=A0ACC0JN83_CHOFU|nr:hypothetical protein MSG28_011424 [Choristoneura fumiferana]
MDRDKRRKLRDGIGLPNLVRNTSKDQEGKPIKWLKIKCLRFEKLKEVLWDSMIITVRLDLGRNADLLEPGNIFEKSSNQGQVTIKLLDSEGKLTSAAPKVMLIKLSPEVVYTSATRGTPSEPGCRPVTRPSSQRLGGRRSSFTTTISPTTSTTVVQQCAHSDFVTIAISDVDECRRQQHAAVISGGRRQSDIVVWWSSSVCSPRSAAEAVSTELVPGAPELSALA